MTKHLTREQTIAFLARRLGDIDIDGLIRNHKDNQKIPFEQYAIVYTAAGLAPYASSLANAALRHQIEKCVKLKASIALQPSKKGTPTERILAEFASLSQSVDFSSLSRPNKTSRRFR